MRRIGQWFVLSELSRLSYEQRDMLSRDIGVSLDDLHQLEQSPDGLNLPQRLAREHVELDVLQEKWPSVLKDMQRVCSLCAKKEQCLYDLILIHSSKWRDYCPNAHTIDNLGARVH